MALCPHHTFQVLTKRPERMREYIRAGRLQLIKSQAFSVMHRYGQMNRFADVENEDHWDDEGQCRATRFKIHYRTSWREIGHAYSKAGVDIGSLADGKIMFRVGKAAAGALLDGEVHDALPKGGA